MRAIEIAFARHIRGYVVEHQIAEDIGNEMDAGLALKHGELRVEIVDLRLQGEHVVDECVEFVFVERRGRINSGAKIAERRLARIVRDLKFARGRAGDKAQPGQVAEQRRDIAEEFALFGVIVERVEARRRVFSPQRVPIAARAEKYCVSPTLPP